MDSILIAIYSLIGIILSFGWWNKHFEKDYSDLEETDERPEKGMAILILLALVAFWPFVLVYKWLNKRTVC